MPKWNHILCSNFFLGILLFFGLLFWLYSVTRPLSDSFQESDTKVYGVVKKVKQKEERVEVWVQEIGKPNLRIFLNQFSDIQVGDNIMAIGKFCKPQNNTIPNGFNYKYYLWYHREKVFFEAESISIIGKSKNIALNFKRGLISIISKRKNHDYLSLFILGDSSKIEHSDREGFQVNGISHLFSISGMHFSFLIEIISYLILKRKNHLGSLILLNVFLLGYLYLVDFIPSACRAFLFWEFKALSNYLKLDWSELRCFFFMIVTILFWKPFYLFDIGFQFSLVLSFFLCEGRELFQNQNSFFRALSFSIFAFSVSLPIALYYYFSINFLSIVWNLFLVPFVTMIFFPIQLFSFFLPPLSFLGYILGEWFEGVSRILQTFDFLIVIFHRPPIWWILLYYLCLFLFLKRFHIRKMIGIIIILIVVLYHWNFFFPQSYFLMIDVGQGDSLLIHSHNQTMLVDTGGNYYQKQGTIYQKKLKPLLSSLGIRKLDVLCLTHGDYDHLGEAFSLIQEMSVKKVYFNEGSSTAEEEKLKSQLERNKIYYDTLKEGDSFQIGNFSFFSLNKEMISENSSSIVLLGIISEFSFLLTGDATVESESYMIEKYRVPELLFLKVGHHGSKTSTSLKLLQEVKPKYSLISVGKNNFYGHPNQEVVDRLKDNSKSIYMTSEDGSIFIKFQKNVTFSLFSP